MAWYYGVDNSELYGSNFSTVLADAPPPLDDTYDEDDDEIVFPNEANKSKEYHGDNVAASVKRSNARDEKISDKSKRDGDLTNVKNRSGEQEDSDFGDFAGFADFGSAFEQENNGESQDWFASNTNGKSVETASGQPAIDDEFADFAAFGDNRDSLNPESIANGGFNQGDSAADVSNNCDKNEGRNEGLPSNGTFDSESDNEFGEFTSTELPSVRSELTLLESDSKRSELQTDLEIKGRTCVQDKVKSDGISDKSETSGVASNYDFDDEKEVSHLRETRANATPEFYNKLNEDTYDVHKEMPSSKQERKVSNHILNYEDSAQLKNSPVAESKTQENIEEDEKTGSNLSRKPDEINITKTNMSDSSKVEHGSGAEVEHENNYSDDDGFDEFTDFTHFSLRPPSLGDDDDDDEKQSNEQLDSSGISKSVGSQEGIDSSCIKGTLVQDKNCVVDDDDGDDFGDFGSFNENFNQSSKSDADFALEDSKQKRSPNDNGVAEDDNDFGNFRISNSEERTLPSDNQVENDFGDFGVFNTSTRDPQNNANDDDDFGEFGTSDSVGKMFPAEDQDKEKFSDSDHFDSNTKELQKDKDSKDDFTEFGSPRLEGKNSTAEDQDDDFDDFGTFRSSGGDSKTDSNNCTDEFGDFGNFASSNSKNSLKHEDNDDFGDFSNFESNTKVNQRHNSNDNSFGDFGAFDSNAKDSQGKNESDGEFGSFGSFESKVTDVPKKKDENLSNVAKSKDGTSDWQQNIEKTKNANDSNKDDDFGDFSGESKEDDSSFASFPSSKTLMESPRETVVPKEKLRESLYFAPGNNVAIKQVGDPVSLCFTTEVKHVSQSQCDVLSMKVKKGFQSELGLWYQLERTDKEGRIPFHWLNSFIQHKKFLSLRIRPDRPPPIQGGSMLKPTVSSQFPPFGGGPAGSMLMPAPPGKLSNSSIGLDFLEPVKGSHHAVHSTAQDITAGHHSVHPEMGLPDLSFVLGGGLKRTASKSDFKDSVSATTSEPSSLELDIFASSRTQTSDAKTVSDSRALYETDLLGLDIFSSSVEPQKLDSPKPQKPSDTNKVWQHGRVTIPLSSQQHKVQLSVAAKTVLNDLEDLSFMCSSVLMFPLKPE